MKEQIRCAVLGLGRLGYWHAENLALKVKGAHLVCVADTNAAHAEKVARELGVRSFTGVPNEIFDDPNIDAIIIASPTSTHAEMIKGAAQSGKSIFVEKPLTLDLAEASETLRFIKEAKVVCQVGFMRRFDPAYAEAKKRVAAGDIGKPIYYKGVSRDPGAPPPEFVKHSGGIFLDMGIHDYDLTRFFMDAEVSSVYAQGNVLVHSFMQEFNDVDQSMTYLTFDSGAAADIESSRNAYYGYDIRGEIMGTEGSILIGSLRHHDITLLTHNGSTQDIVPSFPVRFESAYQLEMEHFVDCLRKNESPSVTEVDGLKALEIAVAAKKSFETGMKVTL
jgi:scyllo-inositol 2-dehydrogenase (NAD+)